MKEILEEVLNRIVPSKEEEQKLMEITKEIEDKINERKPSDAICMLVGSVAKGTYLRHSLDIDFFILFPAKYEKDEMANITISIGKEILDEWTVQFAEHPYIRGFYKSYQVDIVPCYKVRDAKEKISAVDRTPFHTEYIIKNLKEEMKNEVRLLKQFLKGIGCYGAEAKIEGFSGYLAELLILKYETFLNVLEESQKWRGRVIISLNGIDKEFEEGFVFVDPVDPSRNVAAALSKEKLRFFIFAAGEFIKNPKITFFFPNKPPSLDEKTLRKKLENFIGICFKKPNIVDDILYPQLKKAAASLENLLKQNDFKVVKKAWCANDEAFVALQLEEKILPEIKIHIGPPLHEKRHVEAFLERWKNNEMAVGEPFVKGGRMMVKIKRKYVNASDLIKDCLTEINLGKNLNEIKNEMKICDGEYLIKFKNYWDEYFCEKYPWER